MDTRIEKLKIAEIPQYVLEAIAKELTWYLVGFTRIHEDKNVEHASLIGSGTCPYLQASQVSISSMRPLVVKLFFSLY